MQAVHETNDQFPRLLDEARRIPAAEREAWLAALSLSPELKERLARSLVEDVTIDLQPPTGPAPDMAVHNTRGATLSEPPPETGSRTSAAIQRGVSPIDPLIGRTFAGVVIEKILGSGGMGRVYLGQDVGDNKPVALKVLLRTQRDDNVRARFDREARLMTKLRHPCIASVMRTGVEEDGDIDIPYIVMEHVEGALSLTDYVFKQRLGLRDICQLYLQVCDAVGHAHSLGFMHRDLKPANILVNRQGRVKVIDFGVARAVTIDSAAVTVRTETGQLVGTMQYMSPEQFKADPRGIDKRSDVYALCAVLYELLTGIQPFDLRGIPVHEAARIVCDSDAPDVRQCNPHVDAKLAELLTDGLSREPSRRPDDAQAFGRRLKAWLAIPAPTIEQTIHPIHPDKDSRLQDKRAAEPSRHALPSRTTRFAPRPQMVGSGRGSWGLVVMGTLLVTGGALVAFDIVPIKSVIERVRGWTSAVSSAQAAPADTTAKTKDAKPAENTTLEQVRVVTAPEGASIKVNGESKGISPALVLSQMSARGLLQIEASMDGWQTASAQWAVKDGPLVVFNLIPAGEVSSLERVFVLDTSDIAKGCTLTLLGEGGRQLTQKSEPVALQFSKSAGRWGNATIALEAKDAKGNPAEIQIGARRGMGTVSYEVTPEDARGKLKVKVK